MKAFPVPTAETSRGYNVAEFGMDLRDYFMAKAMQGDWAAQSAELGEFRAEISQEALENRARLYYRMADAAMKMRENKDD